MKLQPGRACFASLNYSEHSVSCGMRKSLMLAGLIFFVNLPAMAQGTPRLELSGGFASLQSNFSSTYSPFFFPLTTFGSSFRQNGWQFGFTENLGDLFGVTQEFSGYYGSPSLNGFANNFHTYSFLSGPRFSYRKNSRFVPFAQLLFGYDTTSVQLPSAGLKVTDQSYGMALGGGFEIRLGRALAIRPIEADYFMTQFFGKTQSNIRLSAGVVLQLGRRY